MGQTSSSTDGPAEPTANPGPRRRWRPAGWALGLPALALVVAATTLFVLPEIETEIRRETTRAAGADPNSALARHRARLEVDGRDVTIVADDGLPDMVRSAVEAAVRAIGEVRRVRTEVAPILPLSPFVFEVLRRPGAIRLTGAVPTPEARERLVAEAGRIVAREAVDDRLRLASGAPSDFEAAAAGLVASLGPASQGEATLSGGTVSIRAAAADDAAYEAIRDRIAALPQAFRSALEAEIQPPLMTPYRWSITRDAVGLVLSGGVPSESLRAELAASAATAGLPVRDEMRTARGLDAKVDLSGVVKAALSGLSSLQAGRLQIEGRRVRLEGESVAKSGIAEVERGLRAALPAGLEIGDITIKAVPAVPYRWSASRADGRIALAGYVPAEAERRAAASVIAQRFPGERLVDGRIVADGAPPGFGEAERLALDTLAEFAEGEATIRDRSLVVTGRVLYAQLAARLRSRVPAAAPTGWSASVAIDPVAPERSLDPMLCGDLLADTVRRTPIRFEQGRAEPSAASKPALDSLADLVRRCGSVRIRLVHSISAGKDADAARALAHERAKAIGAAIRADGAADIAPEGTVASGSGAERTEFLVTTREARP